MTTTVVTIAILLVAGLVFQALRAWVHMRGTRLVTCPETLAPAAVEVDVRHFALTSAAGLQELRLRDCSRWPEKQHCGQMCLSEIEAAADGCLVRDQLCRWYEGKSCSLCGRGVAPIHWHDHKPALKGADDRIWEWHEIPAEQLSAFLAQARAVCWSCMIAEGFRHDHPDLFIERPRPPRPATRH